MNTPRISPREWRRVTLFAAIITVLILLPYLVGWAAQTDDMRFSGAVIATDDIQSYLGKMRLGARGLWDFYLFYTPEAHDAVPGVFLPYIAAGQLVGLFFAEDDPALTPALVAGYHIMRIAFTLFLIAVLYCFIAYFLRSPGQRLTALILSMVGGGFGWLLVLLPGGGDWLGSQPPDLFIPEGFGFLIPLALPHLALARALLLLGFLALFAQEAAPSPGRELRAALVAGACWALVGVIVPFYLAVIYCLLAAWVGVLWVRTLRRTKDASPHKSIRAEYAALLRLIVRGGIAAGVTLPLFAYYALAFASNPAFAVWSAQNLLPAPHPLHYLLSYSLFVVPGLFALRWAWRHGRVRAAYILLPAWVLAGALLVYLPINVQRRMSEGIIVPLAILAAHGLAVLLRLRVRRRLRGRVRLALLTFASLTSALLLLTTTFGALSGTAPVFISRAQLDAFAWLDTHMPPDSRILAAMPTGNLIPAYSDLRPYVGHGPETIGALAKEAQTERFYADAMSAEERAALYESVDIRYVFYGAAERMLAGAGGSRADDAPAWANGLTLLYNAGGVQVYQLNDD